MILLPIMILVFVHVISIQASSVVWGQPNDASKASALTEKYSELAPGQNGQPDKDAASQIATNDHEWRKLSLSTRFNEEILIGVVAIISLVTALWFMSRTAIKPAVSDLINATGLILVIFGTIYVVVVAETSEQLTAPIGILGAIAGYLFGRKTGDNTQPNPNPTG